MATDPDRISRWFDYGVVEGKRFMIIVCDTFDWGDYPVYVDPQQNCRKQYEELNGKNMQKVMEVYDLTLNKEQQLNEHRSFHFGDE